MPNSTITAASLLSEVQTFLGGQQVAVELVQQDVNKAITDAVRLFNQYIGLYDWATVAIGTGLTNAEQVNGISAGASASGQLGNGRGALSGSVVFTIPLASNSPATLRDNGNGSLTGTDATGAALTIDASSLNYATGVWSVTLGGGATFSGASGTVTYTTTSALSGARIQVSHPGLVGVTQCMAMSRDDFLGNPDVFEAALFGHRTGIRITGDTHGEYLQQFQYLEQARRISSSEFEWHAQWDRTSGYYYIYYEAAETYSHMSYEYKWHLTPDDDASTGLSWLPDQNADWFVDFVTARAKQTLGRQLRKFGGIATPEGGQDQTDGEQLVSEGREDELRLREAIKLLRPPLPPMIE